MNGTPHSSHARWAVAGLVAGYLVLSALYNRAMPPLEASDEGAHMGMVIHLREEGRLPVVNGRSPIRFLNQEMAQPPLYYALAAAWIRGRDLSDAADCLVPRPGSPVGRADIPGRKHIWQPHPERTGPWRGTLLAVRQIRVLSMLMGLGVVLTVWALARAWWPDEPIVALWAGAWVAFNPMFLFIANAVNNDNLVTLCSSLALWRLARMERAALSATRVAVLGALAGAAILSKLSGLLLLPVLAAAILTRTDASWRSRLKMLVVLGVAAAAVCGWWFVRNRWLYGEWMAIRTHASLLGNLRPARDWWALAREWDGFVKSYWGVFGAFNVIYPDWAYRLFYGLTVLALVAVAAAAVRRRGRIGRMPALLLLFGVLNVGAVGYWTSMLTGSQGRLLFPSIAAHALLWAFGMRDWNRAGRLAMLAVTVLVFALAVWGALAVIPAAYAV